MKRLCAWCGLGMGEIAPLEDERVTHGVCPGCVPQALKDAEGHEEREADAEPPALAPRWYSGGSAVTAVG